LPTLSIWVSLWRDPIRKRRQSAWALLFPTTIRDELANADYHETIGAEGEKLKTELRGLLRITAPTLFGRWHVTPIVANFLDLHPHIRIEVVLTNRNPDLIKEGFDLAVRIGPLTETGLVTRRVGQVRRVLFASPDYLARMGRPRTPKDLRAHEIIFNSHRPPPGGEKQFSDQAVRDPVIVDLRSKIVPLIDPAIKPEQVEMSIELNDGRALR
jgi:DNA-binding transcriptional LysR family regulator